MGRWFAAVHALLWLRRWPYDDRSSRAATNAYTYSATSIATSAALALATTALSIITFAVATAALPIAAIPNTTTAHATAALTATTQLAVAISSAAALATRCVECHSPSRPLARGDRLDWLSRPEPGQLYLLVRRGDCHHLPIPAITCRRLTCCH